MEGGLTTPFDDLVSGCPGWVRGTCGLGVAEACHQVRLAEAGQQPAQHDQGGGDLDGRGQRQLRHAEFGWGHQSADSLPRRAASRGSHPSFRTR
jgi:hypothetical protein